MGKWHHTGCVLCTQNCGLLVQVENNRITAVRGDKDNPRSKGYICRKGMNIANYQHHAQRLKHPLKRVGDRFIQLSWEDAIGEIADKLKSIVDANGPRSFAFIGSGSQGCHFEAGFMMALLKGMGSRYFYSPMAQELTGIFWAIGRITGKQYYITIPDEKETEMLFAVGWNGMVSHQMVRAPLVLREIADDPNKLLVVVDPRKSETAQIANIHLAVRPGTDALMARAMIAIVLQEGWEQTVYIQEHVSGFQAIRNWFENFDAKAALKVCELDYEEVREVCKALSIRKACIHPDLGVYMNRHSTVTSYLLLLLMILTGNFCMKGGNVIPGTIMPIGSHTDERSDRTWRTVETGFHAIMGFFPPNVLPEEIMSEKPDRVRALFCSQSNPLRSYADTTAYEAAFDSLELSVTFEIAMTETAVRSHYVLPNRSGYESWDGTFFAWTFPEVYFQLRRPILEPEGEPLEAGETITRIADKLGLIPDIPVSIQQLFTNRLKYGEELMRYVQNEPGVIKSMPFVIAKTLGQSLGSAHLSMLWGMLMTAPPVFRENAVRACFTDGPTLGDNVFQAIVDNPQGLWIGRCDPDNNFASLKTDDGKLNVHIPEMEEWVLSIDAQSEKKALLNNKEFQFILIAGRHFPMNANTLMRNPEWNKGKRACTVAMNPLDAEENHFIDGQLVRVTTEAGSVDVELEITDEARQGQVLIPHGFGLEYDGRTYGVNVNRLTKNTHRDKLAATPLHRYVPCRVEAI